MKIKKYFFLVIVVSFAFLLPFIIPSLAQEENSDENEEENQEEIEDIQEKIEEYEKKISDLRGKANTLQNEIDYMDSQIGLTQLKIQSSIANIVKTEDRIKELSEGIENLGIRIDKLVKSIEYQEMILGSRMRERYKDRGNSMLMLLFGSNTLNSLVKKTEYLRALEENDNKLIDQMAETRKNFDFRLKRRIWIVIKEASIVKKKQKRSYWPILKTTKQNIRNCWLKQRRSLLLLQDSFRALEEESSEVTNLVRERKVGICPKGMQDGLIKK